MAILQRVTRRNAKVTPLYVKSRFMSEHITLIIKPVFFNTVAVEKAEPSLENSALCSVSSLHPQIANTQSAVGNQSIYGYRPLYGRQFIIGLKALQAVLRHKLTELYGKTASFIPSFHILQEKFLLSQTRKGTLQLIKPVLRKIGTRFKPQFQAPQRKTRTVIKIAAGTHLNIAVKIHFAHGAFSLRSKPQRRKKQHYENNPGLHLVAFKILPGFKRAAKSSLEAASHLTS